MKILAICPTIPARDAKGFQVQTFYRLRHLCRNHSVDIVCFGHGEIDEARKLILTEMGMRVRMLPWCRIYALFSVFKALFNRGIPLQCALFSSPAFRAAVEEIARDRSPNVLYATTIRILPNIHESYPLPLFLDMVDSMGLNFKRRTERAPLWARPFWRFEQSRVASYERAAAQRSAACFVVSNVDKKEIDVIDVKVLPLGIDTEIFSQGAPAKEPNVVLTGNMAYRPNIEAAIWMAKKCWPNLSRAVPQAKFIIAGSRPVPVVRNLSNISMIYVTGLVPSMVDVLQKAQVAVAPMQSGSGMQFKILEAMACGIPVVASTLGLGDIQATPGEDLLVSDSPDGFIESVLLLLKSKELREKIGTAGFRFIQENHTWDAVNNKFESIMTKFLLAQ